MAKNVNVLVFEIKSEDGYLFFFMTLDGIKDQGKNN
tara:strand:+ start:881 stop:988 length:108 start_codon:yes stop_codon:yes gene_type:complete